MSRPSLMWKDSALRCLGFFVKRGACYIQPQFWGDLRYVQSWTMANQQWC